jgi:hypothetical protein
LRIEIDKRLFTTIVAAFVAICLVVFVLALLWNVLVWLLS